ncbi:E3 ubiquitin ligase BIG BROTHER-related isoform X2 [Daucus carota subsp. sativus]|uniref:RING-type domain-containing protein n=1 Tax=Daucus carota subsp. sativus TaxID=79200 RepID=A0A161ZW94_DAUCS|nr:PREDICTED: E3 ubiquitin ligase BIG BROTHER-related isoform X2 [Daucus carota subsp. sativus]
MLLLISTRERERAAAHLSISVLLLQSEGNIFIIWNLRSPTVSLAMMRNIEFQDPYLAGNIPAEIAENWKEFFPENEDFSCEEVLVQQESVYLSIQENGRDKRSTSGCSHSSDKSHLVSEKGGSSHGGSNNSQVALDEALARSLQELGDDFEDFYPHEDNGAEAGTRIREVSTVETPTRAVTHNLIQDDIDPDNMTYEQLQSLGESIGSENKGLPEELIARLPTFKYKSGFFSKKKKEECVICCMVYSTGERLINLPCAHQYHSACIKRWLSVNKQCPVCQTEVQDE